jgi:hypothetical protein
VAEFDLAADTRVPYRTMEIPLPALAGSRPFELSLDSRSAHPARLGMALDWMELERRGPASARFGLPGGVLARLAACVLAAFAAIRLCGGDRRLAAALGASVAACATLGAWADVLAFERIVREGAAAFLAVAAVCVALLRVRRLRAALAVESDAAAGVLATLVLVALGVRLVLLLHPGFYYPDVRVHAMFAWQVARHGLAAFLRDFTESQFRYSLGLQFENGHWYAFPYPPLFYVLTWPLVRLLRYRPEVAVSLLAAGLNALEAILVFAIGRRLALGPAVALAAAAAHPLLPIFLARLSLAYFPALVGHFVDAVVILYLAARLPRLDRPRTVLALAGLIALALLTYTQSLLNFGLLLPLLLLLQLAFDRTPGARRRQVGLAAAGVLGALLSLAVFYGRYVPVFLDMRRGVPMREEQVLIEKQARQRPSAEEPEPQTPDDPYAGAGLDPLRGLRKAAWRMYVFYAWFAPAVVAGLVLLHRSSSRDAARLIAAWALTYLVLNLASGGLPGPNLVRYNKDMEVVAPLFCLGLGAVGVWLAQVAKPLGLAFAVSYWVFGARRAARYLTEKFVLER